MIPAILATLLTNGLALVGNAFLAKGKDWIEEKTGIDLTKASLSNEDLVKLKQFEMDHEEELIKLRQADDKLAQELELAYLQDTQGARSMQIAALGQNDPFSKNFIYYYAMMWTGAAIAYIGFITFGEIPEANVRFADTILGFILGTVVAQIINFFFGSSRSSQKKDAETASVMHKLIDTGKSK